MNTRKENILVTGATGFLGSHLVKRLDNLNYSVLAIGRNTKIGRSLESKNVHFMQVSLENTEQVSTACSGIDYVFHCGALSSPWGRPKDYYNSNVIGTKNIINACIKHKIKRLIHVSTTSIYFEYKDKYNLREDIELPKEFVNDYAKTKSLAEQELDRAFIKGLPVVTIRPSGIFGPGDTSILPRLIQANNKKFIPIISDKQVHVDITYVDNVVDALLLCKDAPDKVLGKKYNITNDDPISIYEFLENLIIKLGYKFNPIRLPFKIMYAIAGILEFLYKHLFLYTKEPPLTQYSVGILAFSKTLDISAAKNDLGYSPRIKINEAVKEVIKSWHNTYVR